MNRRLRALGWKRKTELRDGIAQVYEAFRKYAGRRCGPCGEKGGAGTSPGGLSASRIAQADAHQLHGILHGGGSGPAGGQLPLVHQQRIGCGGTQCRT